MPDILLLNPPVEAVDRYAENHKGLLKAIIEDWDAFCEIQHRHGKKNPICYMTVTGYLRGVNCQRYDKIVVFDTNADTLTDATIVLARRALKFNGTVEFANGDTWITKDPGFLLCSYPRCGTHMVVTSLSNHPQVKMYGEVFNPGSQNGTHKFPDPRQVTEAFWTGPHVGIAAHAYIGRKPGVLRFMGPQKWYNDLWQHLPSKLRVISLRRRDLLARFVSHSKAKQTNVWNRYGDDTRKVTQSVSVDVEQLLKDADFVKGCWKAIDEQFPDCLVVYYEDMCSQWEVEQRRIQEYLKLKPAEVVPSSNKVGRSLQEDVSNYGQIVNALNKKKAWNRLKG